MKPKKVITFILFEFHNINSNTEYLNEFKKSNTFWLLVILKIVILNIFFNCFMFWDFN